MYKVWTDTHTHRPCQLTVPSFVHTPRDNLYTSDNTVVLTALLYKAESASKGGKSQNLNDRMKRVSFSLVIETCVQ